MLRAAAAAALVAAAAAVSGGGPSAAAPPTPAPPASLLPSQCAAAGFAAGAVSCATCAELGKVLGSSDPAVSACGSCCSPAVDAVSSRRFDGATLYVNRAMGGAGGGVGEWLEKSAARWAGRVDVVDSFVAAPVLVLKDDGSGDGGDGGAAAGDGGAGGQGKGRSRRARALGLDATGGLTVGNWKIEQIDAFLEAKLREE